MSINESTAVIRARQTFIDELVRATKVEAHMRSQRYENDPIPIINALWHHLWKLADLSLQHFSVVTIPLINEVVQRLGVTWDNEDSLHLWECHKNMVRKISPILRDGASLIDSLYDLRRSANDRNKLYKRLLLNPYLSLSDVRTLCSRLAAHVYFNTWDELPDIFVVAAHWKYFDFINTLTYRWDGPLCTHVSFLPLHCHSVNGAANKTRFLTRVLDWYPREILPQRAAATSLQRLNHKHLVYGHWTVDELLTYPIDNPPGEFDVAVFPGATLPIIQRYTTSPAGLTEISTGSATRTEAELLLDERLNIASTLYLLRCREPPRSRRGILQDFIANHLPTFMSVPRIHELLKQARQHGVTDIDPLLQCLPLEFPLCARANSVTRVDSKLPLTTATPKLADYAFDYYWWTTHERYVADVFALIVFHCDDYLRCSSDELVAL